MNNDGGWCWMNSTEGQRGLTSGPFLKTLREPANGTLQIDVLRPSTRVAYRPNPGFVGTDSLKTRSMTLNYEVEYQATVTR